MTHLDKINPAHIEDILPLTPVQGGMLSHHLREPSGEMYVSQAALDIEGTLDAGAVEEAWNRLLRKHAMLRCVFRWREIERPVQVVLRKYEIKVFYSDLEGLDDGDKNAGFEELLRRERLGCADLSGVPFRVLVCKIDSHLHKMVVSNHHLLYDGWSGGILLADFLDAYHDAVAGLPDASSTRPQVQFKEFLRWLENHNKKEDELFWREYMNDYQSCRFPLIRSSATGSRNATACVRRIIPEDVFETLQRFLRDNQLSIATFLYGAWGLTLRRYCGTDDVAFGTTVSGRPPEIESVERIVGMFINTVPLRIQTSARETGRDYLQGIHGALRRRAFFEHAALTDIAEWGLMESADALFDTIMVIENYPVDMASLKRPLPHGASASPATVLEISHYDLALRVVPSDSELGIDFMFFRETIDEECVLRLADHVLNLAAGLLINPLQPVGELDLLSEDEREEILARFSNSGDASYPNAASVLELLEERVRRTPFAVALAGNDRSSSEQLSCAYLDHLSDRVAAGLRKSSGKTDSIVGIIGDQSLELVIGIVGILKSGNGFLPMDPHTPAARIRYQLADSGAEVLLVAGDDATLPDGILVSGGVFRVGDLAGDADGNLESRSSSTAYVIYTSGSSGRPKGVMIERRSLVNLTAWHIHHFQVTTADRAAKYAATGFDASVWEIFPNIVAGAPLIIVPPVLRLELNLLNWFFHRHCITIAFLPTDVCRQFMELENWSLRVLLTGGSQLKHFEKRAYALYNNYGPTECTVVCASYLVSGLESNIPIGKPAAGCRLYIVDHQGLHVQPVGAPGELCVAGPGLATGYASDPQLTAEKFTPHPLLGGERIYRTGDRARWRADGNIEFWGRIDRQVKIRGFRIETGEIEAMLLRHPAVHEAVVMPFDRLDEGGDSLCAYIVPGDGGAASPEELRDFLSRELPPYMAPSFFVSLSSLPLTQNGKVDRDALAAIRPDVATTGYAAPRGKVEASLVELAAGVLGIDASVIGVFSNLFNLGLHSLKATLLAAKVRNVFKVDFPLKQLFDRPFVAAMAEFVAQAARLREEEIPPVEKRDYYPLSSAQKRLFFLSQFEDTGISYNMPSVVDIDGELELPRLQEAFRRLVERHESLRTAFVMAGDQPVQRIVDRAEIPVEHLSMAEDLPGAPSEEASLQRVVHSFIRPFCLDEPPLLRLGILALSGNRCKLLFDMHHIISDGTSMANLVRDFDAFYNQTPVRPLTVQYKDYAVWQNEREVGGELCKQETYWLGLLAGDIPVLRLPADHARPPVFTFAGDRHSFIVPRSRLGKFFSLETRYGNTLFMNLLAAFYVLLNRLTGQEDIVVGTSIAGRRHPGIQNTVGMFVNALAMRAAPVAEVSIASFLRDVGMLCREAFENQDVQFERLVELLDPSRDPSRNPIFDVCLVAQNFGSIQSRTAGLAFDQKGYRSGTSKFDLTFFVYETGDDVIFDLEYYTGIFTADTVARLGNYYLNTIFAMALDPSAVLADIDIVGPGERLRLIHDFNQTQAPLPREKMAHQLFSAVVERHPHRLAMIEGDTCVTYECLDRRANRLANYLQHQDDFRLESVVSVLFEPSIDLAEAVLGILKAGGVFLPLDPDAPLARMKRIIDDSTSGIIISQKRYIDRLNRLQWECPLCRAIVCIDSDNVIDEKERSRNALMEAELWDYVAETASDGITGGGWNSSYTGEPFSVEEMAEYSANVKKKLEPMLSERTRVLEIGCASGLTMYAIAPKTAFYYGTDLSEGMIRRNRQRVEAEGISNITLSAVPAHHIDRLEAGEFDLVIVNSVVQSFHGLNYLRKVIAGAVVKLAMKGCLFIGDVMDLERKQDLIRDLADFKRKHPGRGRTAKLDWESELFVGRGFFHDLASEIPGIERVEISDKIFTIENELTKFRYDVLIYVNKRRAAVASGAGKLKLQHDEGDLARYGETLPSLPVDPGRLAYVIYTSGTSGTPKGVMIEHRSLVNYIDWSARHYLQERAEIVYIPLYTALAFDMTITSLFLPLATGNAIVVYREQTQGDEAPIYRILADGIAGLVKATPSHLKLLQTGYPELRFQTRPLTVIVGGEQLEASVARWLTGSYPGLVKIYNEYGPTEATVGCMHYLFDVERDRRDAVPVGEPVGNGRIYICDDRLRPVPFNAVGQMFIGGAGLARGYLNRPDLTAQRFIDDPFVPGAKIYATGDLARRRADGVIEYIGRLDSQVKIRGYRIEVGDVEHHLLLYPGVTDAIVIPFEDGVGEVELRAYILGLPEESDPLDIRGFLAARLPAYMIPGKLFFLDALPLAPSGKVDTRALLRTGSRGAGDYTAPCDRLEFELAMLWAELLKLPEDVIGIDASFFDLGGHSLKATACVSRIAREFHVKVSLVDFFNYPTIRGLARLIRAQRPLRYLEIPAAEKKDYYPVTPSQGRLYLLQILNPESTLYNETAGYELEGALEIPRLEQSIGELIRRHEMLRTSFRVIDGFPVQRIHPEAAFAVEELTLDEDSSDCRRTMARFVRPFDLEMPPLFRVGLVRLADRRYWLMVDFHHIVCDGMSLAVVIREFSALSRDARLPEPVLRYRDFAEWQQRPDFIEALDGQKRFWLEQFSGEIPRLDLPLDFPRRQNGAMTGEALEFVLDSDESDFVMHAAASGQATLYMFLLAAQAVFLGKITGQMDIVVGTPVAGRPAPELEAVVGMFVQTLALRMALRDDISFDSFLRTVKETAIRAFDHQDYPFDRLVADLGMITDAGRNPLFDVMFAWQNIDDASLDIPGVTVSALESGLVRAKFDLAWHGWQEGRDICFLVQYDNALFAKHTIERFVGYYRHILRTAAAKPQILLRDIAIITEEETHTILHEFNSPADGVPPEGATIHSYFDRQASLYPDRLAVIGPSVDGEAELQATYGELKLRAGRMAGYLAQKGVGKDTLVAVSMDRYVELLTCLLGILKAGGAYLPIMPNLPSGRVRLILDDSDAPLLVTDSPQPNTVACAADVVDIRDALAAAHHAEAAVEAGLAYCIYTSGSTGSPKGVLIDHRPVANLLLALQRLYPLGENDTWLFKTAFSFDVSVVELFGWFMGGGRVAVLEHGGELNPRTILRWVERFAVSRLNFVPAAFGAFAAALAEDVIGKLSSLNYIFLAGELLEVSLVAAFRAIAPDIQLENLYGPTEATVYASFYSIYEREFEKKIPIGKPLPNVSLHILDRAGRLQPPGIAGELCIGGAGLFRGYLNRPDSTADCLMPHPFIAGDILYKTGDLARWRMDGDIEFLGRTDHQVKLRGFRIELGEIEFRLLAYPGIREAVVVARKAALPELYLCAYVVSKTDSKPASAELRGFLSEVLPEYMIPSFFTVLDRMPLTSSGKVDRQGLPLPDMTGVGPVVTPRDSMERRLAAIWADVLSLDEEIVGIDHNFFELGGHSLNALQAANRIQTELGLDARMLDLFQANTIRALSERLRLRTPRLGGALAVAEKRDFYPVASAQKRFYLLQRMDKSGISYNMPSFWTVEGVFEPQKLERALKRMIERHENLRTAFVMKDDEPVQRVYPANAVRMKIEKYDDPDGFIRPFDLAVPPLLRAGLIAQSQNRHILLLDMHHIIADGPSLELFFDDLSVLYNGEEPPLPPFTYTDYCRWFAAIAGEEMNRQEAYWLEQFFGDLPVLMLPTDFPRPPAQTFAGTNHHFQLDRDMAAGLRELAVFENTTLHMVLLALFFVFLNKMSGAEDIVVGITATGRRREELSRIIGLFVNTLPIRAACRRSSSFRSVLRSVDDLVLRGFENQDYPLERLVSQLSANRDASRNPLFDVMFTMQDALIFTNEAAGLTFSPFVRGSASSKFDMTLDVLRAGDDLHFSIGYNTDLFKEETIVRFGGYLRNLIEAALRDSGILLEAIDVTPAHEKEMILYQFNAKHPSALDAGFAYAGSLAEAEGSIPEAVRAHLAVYRLTKGTCWLSLLQPLSPEFQVWSQAALAAGVTLCLPEAGRRLEMPLIERFIASHGVIALVADWEAMGAILDTDGMRFPSSLERVVVVGCVPEDDLLLRAVRACPPEKLSMQYSIAGVQSLLATLEYREDEAGFGTLAARPAGFKALAVLNDAGLLQPIGVAGRVAVAEEHQNWLPTGDNGRFLSDGTIELKRTEKRSQLIQAETSCVGGGREVKTMNNIEKVLLEVWRDVLGVEDIGLNDDFFALGGDSLKALSIIVKLEALNFQLDITDLFFNPNIASLHPFVNEVKCIKIEPQEKREYYDVSSSQKRFFILQNRDVHSTVYNMPGSVVLKKNIDKDRLEKAFLRLILRHESLRTSFSIVNGELVQWVRQDVEFSLDRISTDETGIHEFLGEFVRAFNLEIAPLFRVTLLEISGDAPSQELFFDIHHIIADGISCNILMREALAFYEGIPLPELELQYRDFAGWQNGEFGGELFQSQEEYWLNEFAGGAPRLELPTDFPGSGVSQFAGDSIGFAIDSDDAGALRKLAELTGCTFYMVVLAIFATLLWRLSGQQKIVVGTPVSGRRNDALNSLVGLFINTVVFCFSPDPSIPFVDFLHSVREKVADGLKNQDYPFENLLDKLNLNWEFGRNPLFDAMLSYFVKEKNPAEEYRGEQLSVSAYNLKNHTAKFDLVLHVLDDGSSVSFSFEYSTVLFKEETIERFAGEFKEIVGLVARNSQQKMEKFVQSKKFVNIESGLSGQLDQDFDF